MERKKTNGHGKHGEKKGKTGGTTIELPTNTPALSKKPNKSEAKKSMKTTERKVKAKGKQKLIWPVHQRLVQGLRKNSSTLTGPCQSHGTIRLTLQFVANMLFSI